MYEVVGLTLSFGNKNLLEETNLYFEKGSLYTIYGPSGAGKSTLLNAIGLLSNTDNKAKYYFNGTEINTADPKVVSSFIAEEIAFIFQEYNVLRDCTVFDNLSLPLLQSGLTQEDSEKKIEETLRLLHIEHLKNSYPEDLSGGEEQRVAIGRALVGNKSIILADEPTNSLDKFNRDSIHSLLVSLAKHFNKIVIVVSHDENLIEKGDVQLQFVNKKLVGNAIVHSKLKKSDQRWIPKTSKHPVRLPIRNHRRAKIPKILLGIVSLIIAIAVGSINFQSLFTSKYEQLINNSLENGFLIINDSLHLQTSQVLEDFISFNSTEIESIVNSNYVTSYSPYLEFPYFGMTIENSKNYTDSLQSLIPELSVNGQTVALKKGYSIQPLFDTNTTQRQIDYFDSTTENGIYVSEQWLAQEELDNIQQGTILTVDFYVPVKQYESIIEMNGQTLSGDGDLYVKKQKELPVLGIVSKNYPFNYSPNGNTLFMAQKEMVQIQKQAIDERPVEMTSLDSYTLKDWKPSALHITVDNSTTIPAEISRIKQLSSNYSIVSTVDNYEQFSKGVTYIKQLLLVISLVLMLLVIAILSFIFYLTSKSRKYEVGLLKGLGFTTNQVMNQFFRELLSYGKTLFRYTSIILFIILIILTNLLSLELIDITKFYITSLLIVFITSFAVLITSGLVPIYCTCKQSAVDAIRINR